MTKMSAGDTFPSITVAKLGGGELTLGKAEGECDWSLIVVYRGKHCPICTNYLKTLNGLTKELKALKVSVAVVSADSKEQAEMQMELVSPEYPVGYGLSIEQMQALGLYISEPRSEKETDHIFAEPGLFVVNEKGNAHLVDISNAPFLRPDLSMIVGGITFIRNPENNYPIRGTYVG